MRYLLSRRIAIVFVVIFGLLVAPLLQYTPSAHAQSEYVDPTKTKECAEYSGMNNNQGAFHCIKYKDKLTCPANYTLVGERCKLNVANTTTSAAASAVYEKLEGVVGPLYKQGCRADSTSDIERSGCVPDGIVKVTYQCYNQAHSIPGAKGEATITSEFSRCMNQKAKLDEQALKSALTKAANSDNFKWESVSKAASEAWSGAKTANDKESCTAQGGEWDEAKNECSNAKEEKNSCAIEGIGWMICPTINFLANIADVAYDFLADHFLTIPASMFNRSSDGGKPLFDAWQSFANIANAVLIVGFLVVIFSQVTNAGISNYGIKKMLPKIIVAAILINLSFYICALAIDISNITGFALRDLLKNLAPDAASAGFAATGEGGWGKLAALTLGGAAVAGGVAAAGGVSLALVALLGFLSSGVISLVTIFIILTIRQVFIVMLVVLAPLAFAMMFLPNTSQWFDRWKKTFIALLMVFPTIGVIFGISSLAGAILTNVFVNDKNGDTLGQILSSGITILPLVVVPSVIKKSLDSVGTIGNKLSGLGSKLSGGAKNKLDNSAFAKHQEQRAARRTAEKQAGTFKGRGGRLNPSNWRSALNRRINNSERFNKATGGFGERRAVMGASVAAAQDKEAMEAAAASVDSMNLGSNELMEAIQEGAIYERDAKGEIKRDDNGNKIAKVKFNTNQRRAAIRSMEKLATADDLSTMANMSNTIGNGLSAKEGTQLRNELMNTVAANQSKSPWLGGATLDSIRTGTFNEDQAMDSYTTGKMQAKQLATMDAKSLQKLVNRAETKKAAGDTQNMDALVSSRNALRASSEEMASASVASRTILNKLE